MVEPVLKGRRGLFVSGFWHILADFIDVKILIGGTTYCLETVNLVIQMGNIFTGKKMNTESPSSVFHCVEPQ